mgnify:CR=1 FL=1
MKKFFKNVKNIAWLCRPYWKYGKLYLILFITISVFLAPVKDVIYVFFPEKVVDLLVSGKSFQYVAVFASIICGIAFITYLIPCFFFCYFQRKSVYIDLKIKRDIYEKALHIDYKYIDNPEYYNKYAWALNEYADQANAACDFIKNFLQYFLTITVLLSIIATIGPWILLIEAVQLVLHALINARENKIKIKKKDELMPINRRLSYFHRLFYMKEYSADIKSTSLNEFVFTKYEKAGKSNIEIVNRYAKITLFLGMLHETIFAVTEFIIITYLIYNITIGNIAEVGLYITMILAFYRADSKLQGFIRLLKTANELSLNAEKIYTFFDIKSEIEIDKQKKLVPNNEVFSVELRNVGFAYENSGFALSNMNISIKPGEKIAIVGENGAGKSTFIKLLLRLYDVSNGEILINGNPIKEYDVRALRKKIGIAFQNPNIYAMTFSENISLYNEIPEMELDKISEKFGLKSILEKNNVGYDVELTREFEEQGIILSGGETQKIALARIMTGDFGLLLLDEPSSALDPIAEYKMNELILGVANKTTTIMVAHRLSTTRNADRIVLIDNGEIKESGTHDELMALCGKYYEMFTKQAENYV